MEQFITLIRESFGSAEKVYTEGSCWQFYKIVSFVYPGCKPWYDEIAGHVFIEHQGLLWDIEGCHGPIEDYSMVKKYDLDADEEDVWLVEIPNDDITLEELEIWRHE